MLQAIPATIAAVVAMLVGYMICFPESGGGGPGREFGSGLAWLTLGLYVIGFISWVVGLVGLFFKRQRYRVILQVASAVVYFWPPVAITTSIVRDRYFNVHVKAEYVLEWKVPAQWKSKDLKCEIHGGGGIDGCPVKQGQIRGDSLEVFGGPVHVWCERQIVCLEVWHRDRRGFDDYIFPVDLHDKKQAGETSDWLPARSWNTSKDPSARALFFRHGDPSGFPLVQNPTLQMRYRIVSVERKRGR
jgi:hypothetical protein